MSTQRSVYYRISGVSEKVERDLCYFYYTDTQGPYMHVLLLSKTPHISLQVQIKFVGVVSILTSNHIIEINIIWTDYLLPGPGASNIFRPVTTWELLPDNDELRESMAMGWSEVRT